MAPSAFAWLTDLHKSQCYTTGDWSNPAKTIDFGDNGHTASLTDWHELLQVTAPDPLCGLVFVRGDFPNTADAILARAQQLDHSGKKGTFGLQIESNGSDFMLGERRNQGSVNFRWPYIQYELKRRYSDGGVEQIHVGTYEAISFVKDNIVFQIICIRPGRIHEPPRGVVDDAKLGTQDRIQAQMAEAEDTIAADKRKLKIKFKMGGNIQFGCPCSSGQPTDDEAVEPIPKDLHQLLTKKDGKLLFYVSKTYQKCLEMQLFVNDELKTLIRPSSEHGLFRDGKPYSFATHDVAVEAGSTTFVTATYALRDCARTEPILKLDSFKYIADYLGVPNDSEKMSDRLWTACLTTNYDAAEAMEFCAIGTAVEKTLCVSSVPISIKSKEEGSAGRTPNQIGKSPENDFGNEGVALVRNIMFGQYVDLQSAL